MSDMNEREYMQSGEESLAAGDYNAAQVFFKQAIRVNNANEDAWLLLAKTYPTEPDKALKCYENVLKINPLNAEAQRMIERLQASEMPAYSSAGGAAAASVTEDALRSETVNGPAARKPLGGPSMSAPRGVDGAPEQVNLDYLVDFYQRGFRSSTATVTGQGDGSTDLSTSWWNATLLTISAGVLTGLMVFIANVDFRSFLTILTVPLVVTLLTVIGVGAASFLSHWYMRTYREGSASLLDHTMSFVRIWFPASIIFAVVHLIADLTGNFVMSVGSFLQTFAFSARDLGLILLIVNIAVAGFSAVLLHRAWTRLYPAAGSTNVWVAVAIALTIVNLVLLF
jgi:hypothetical protein